MTERHAVPSRDAVGGDPVAHRVCDYEGSPYRRAFWEEADRSYEDATERLALRRLLPPRGERVVEIGAGFGRLADEYRGYRQIILLDYARSMLEDAHARLTATQTAAAPDFRFVCADLYRLPFASQSLDVAVQVRVLHHVEDVPRAFAEVSRALRVGGSYVLEYANKRNLKSIARYALGKQAERPFDRRPYEFIELNWNFHPAYVQAALEAAGLEAREALAVSHFRQARLKRRFSPQLLARADALLGRPLAGLALAPSQFVRALRTTGGQPAAGLWRCPRCGAEPLTEREDGVPCTGCGAFWPKVGGIYLFRQDLID
ncbi:MAG: methyltransferase domain-containing protein [Chloroflexi bacterium]|nr:methyltransferase domain-containing protein [Chloroflexota bacterium]